MDQHPIRVVGIPTHLIGQGIRDTLRRHWLEADFTFYLPQKSLTSLVLFYFKENLQQDATFLCVCPLIDGEFRHNFVKGVCTSTSLSRLSWCLLR